MKPSQHHKIRALEPAVHGESGESGLDSQALIDKI